MSVHEQSLFTCANLDVDVENRVLVHDLDLHVDGGEFVAILGKNGAGKSLTLHTLAGLRPAANGRIEIDGNLLNEYSRQDIAKRLSLLPQHVDDIFPATVLDTALIGRHPYIGRLSWESRSDVDAAMDALTDVDLCALKDRDVMTLSGGERRRLAIAQILTQAPRLYLLDEPTNHLDPQHQLDALHLFRNKVDNGAAVLASVHDVNLALRFADRCLLLYGDGQWDSGDTHAVLTEERLSQLYGTTMEAVDWRGQTLFVAAGQETAQ